jgi:hypothetical protein
VSETKREVVTVTVTDPTHEFYGRIGVITYTSKWYTHVRILYHNTVQILEKHQYRMNDNS